MREVLSDPDSAQFRNDRVVEQVVCGEVNAKNAMGGYGGFREYIYFRASNRAEVDPGDADIDASTNFIRRQTRLCYQNGVPENPLDRVGASAGKKDAERNRQDAEADEIENQANAMEAAADKAVREATR